MKSPLYRHAVFAAACLGLLLLPVGCYELKVSFEPDSTQPETSSQQESAMASTVSNPAPTPTPKSSLFTYNQGSADKGKGVGQGSLRMSNQTTQPVRLALLTQRSQAKSASGQTKYNNMPAHWDFAPGEGSEKGLILSLPNGNFKLEKGDVLVAFAQDGSRRYWGPYVVGETSAPVWNGQKREWELILSP